MCIDRFIWDLDNDPRGNVRHIAENGLTQDEVEEVLDAADEKDITYSNRSNLPMVFGFTSTGKYIAVVFSVIKEDLFTVRAVTAYETEF